MIPKTKAQDTYRDELVILLNTLLNDESVLFTKTRDAQWKISGTNFPVLHLFFKNQYETIDLSIKTIALLINSFGHLASGSLVDAMGTTYEGKNADEGADYRNILNILQSDHDAIILSIQKFIIPKSGRNNDQSTTNLMTELISQHKKMNHMLRAYQI